MHFVWIELIYFSSKTNSQSRYMRHVHIPAIPDTVKQAVLFIYSTGNQYCVQQKHFLILLILRKQTVHLLNTS